MSIWLDPDESRLEQVKALEDADVPWTCAVTPEEIIYTVKQVGFFRVRQGNTVRITPLPGVDDRLLSLYIVGSIMAFLNYQRGRVTLHASALNMGGAVVAFVGDSGAGKSSMAAALHRRGHPLVTDDVLPIQVRPHAVFPAFPQLKLHAEVAQALDCQTDTLVELHPRLAKLGYRPSQPFSTQSLPLQAIYVLAEGELAIEPLLPPQALLELIRYSYGVRALQPLINSPTYFAHCTDLVSQIPVYRLTRPLSLVDLPSLAETIEAHVMKANCSSMPVSSLLTV